jgi:endonuclease III
MRLSGVKNLRCGHLHQRKSPLPQPMSLSALEHLDQIDLLLSEHYGRPRWRSHGDPLDELIATVLSQHTSDVNTERAFASLRGQFPDWSDVMSAPVEDVAMAIRSGGLANLKAPRIQRILSAIEEQLGELSLESLRTIPLEDARRWLCRLPGVGPKTAACVLLFSLGLPAMPVDTHVHRVSRRLGLIESSLDANAAHASFDSLLGSDRDLVYALHLNLIQHGRAVCKARFPRCGTCVLAAVCPSANY